MKSLNSQHSIPRTPYIVHDMYECINVLRTNVQCAMYAAELSCRSECDILDPLFWFSGPERAPMEYGDGDLTFGVTTYGRHVYLGMSSKSTPYSIQFSPWDMTSMIQNMENREPGELDSIHRGTMAPSATLVHYASHGHKEQYSID